MENQIAIYFDTKHQYSNETLKKGALCSHILLITTMLIEYITINIF